LSAGAEANRAGPTVDTLIRRQLIMAVVAGAVVLVAVVMVAWAIPDGDAGSAVMRVAPDGSRVITPSAAESPRWAMWVTVAALVAVAGVLVMLLHHTVRVARSALATSTSRGMR